MNEIEKVRLSRSHNVCVFCEEDAGELPPVVCFRCYRHHKHQECCICGGEIIGYGNNPFPVKSEGRCCDRCDETIVIPRRIDMIVKRGDKPMEGEIP